MIDFSKMPMLVGPRFKQTKNGRDDREKLARVKEERGKRTHPKRHSTNKERSLHAQAKSRQKAQAMRESNRRIHDIKNEVAAYWRGERDDYPE